MFDKFSYGLDFERGPMFIPGAYNVFGGTIINLDEWDEPTPVMGTLGRLDGEDENDEVAYVTSPVDERLKRQQLSAERVVPNAPVEAGVPCYFCGRPKKIGEAFYRVRSSQAITCPKCAYDHLGDSPTVK